MKTLSTTCRPQEEIEWEATLLGAGWTEPYPGRYSPPGSPLKFNLLDAWAMRHQFRSAPALEVPTLPEPAPAPTCCPTCGQPLPKEKS